MSEYENLSDREIDALVAERVMGWRHHESSGVIWWSVPDGPVGQAEEVLDRFSTDDNAARLVRDRIAELGLQDEWCRAINDLLEPQRIAQRANELIARTFIFTWIGYQSTARQQCIAALQAIEGQR